MNIELKAISKEHGFRDFDVMGHNHIKRVCVPLKPKNGDVFNAYLHTPEGRKEGITFNKTIIDSIKSLKIISKKEEQLQKERLENLIKNRTEARNQLIKGREELFKKQSALEYEINNLIL